MKRIIAIVAIILASCLAACQEKPAQAIGVVHMATLETGPCKFLIMPV